MWCLMGGLWLLPGLRSASGQSTSPLTVSGGNSSELQLIKTDGVDRTWTVSGSESTFAISDNNNIIIRSDSDAPVNCLAIDSTGRIFFCPGESLTTPQRSLHVLNPSPALRLEKSNGVNPTQAFDLDVSALGFAIIDATNDNQIPFAIEPGAPTNSLFVDAVGNVGVGTGTPTAPLHLAKLAQASTAEILARFAITDDASGSLVIANSSAGDGVFIPKLTGRSGSSNAALINEALITTDVGASPAIVYNAAKGAGGALVTRPLVVYRNNGAAKATIAANGEITATSFNPTSSRTIKHDIVDLDSQTADDALRQLTPVQFVYNGDESNEKRVGFIAEDVPEIVANADRQSVPIMDVVALLTKVVKDQQQTIDEQRKANDEQMKSIARQQETNGQQQKSIDLLMKRLEALESQASVGK